MIPKSETKKDQATSHLIVEGQKNLVIVLRMTVGLLPTLVWLALQLVDGLSTEEQACSGEHSC